MGYRKSWRSRLAGAALVVVAALAGAGCGGDDGDEGLSTKEFIAEADAICREAEKKQRGPGGKVRPGAYGDNFSDPEFLANFNAATKDALKELKALDAPESERKAVGDLLSAIEGSAAAIDRQIAALRAKDTPKQSKANEDWIRRYGDIVALAGALGLTDCQALGN